MDIGSNPSLLPHILWSYQNLAPFPQNDCLHTVKCIMTCIRDSPFTHKQKWNKKRVHVKMQTVFPTNAGGFVLVE